MTNRLPAGGRESRRPRSAELYERACRVIPGGVSSPVRAFRAVGGTPLFIARGAGAQVFDADGRAYLDFVGSWGPLIAGHAHPAVIASVSEALARGMTYGAPCAAEVELAERVVAAYPCAEQVRFVSSASSSSNSPAATTVTPITCWWRQAPGSPPSAGRPRPVCRRLSPPARAYCRSMTRGPWPSSSPARAHASPR